MANVVVVRQGNLYSGKYVRVLRNQIKKNTTWEHDFHVIGDGKDADIPLVRNWKGWFSKLELFSPWNADIRPCLYLDLDTFVLGNIDDLVCSVPTKLAMLRDFNNPDTGQSAIMSIPKDTKQIWKVFTAHADLWMEKYRHAGDQAFLNKFDFDFIQDKFPGIASYKVHNLQKDPGLYRIVCWHGEPKPHQCDGWVREVWKAA